MSRKLTRCSWVSNDPEYIKYHDLEWGVPIYDDQKIFEALMLEILQAGLSWVIILKKRNSLRIAFDNFNYRKIAIYSIKKLNKLKSDPNVIRNSRKIIAITNNAKAFIKVQKEFGSFSKYLWGFVKEDPINNNFSRLEDIPSETKLSKKISNDLKKRGFKFIGPIITYSHMQAIGMINNHMRNCFKNNSTIILNT